MGEAGPGHIFLSHNAQDKAEVEVLARQLLDRGLRPWLDKWEIAAGRSWQEALQEAIEQASAVLVCVGQHGLGRVQLPEVEAALDRAFQDSARMVIPVFLPGAQGLELPPFLKQRSWVDLRQGESAARQLFAALGTGSSLAPAPRGAEGSPFRGLEAFEERHARWFFGREVYLSRLLGALRERRLLALIGASGSGKSSLVRAGLIPAVRTGELDQSYAWVPLLLRPGARPLHELALRVANALGVSREVSALREGMLRERGLLADELDREAVRTAQELRFLLVVDQFEEVFTLCEDKAARAAFIDALLHAASVPGGRTHVVWTLRADFMTQLLEHPGLAEPLDRSNLLLGPMSAAELRSVIRRPALIAGLELESGLEDLLVQGVAGEPGDLPLLQFALEELWQQREGSRMTLAAYRRMGGLKGAIARRADSELAVLDDPQRALVRRLFGRLVRLGEGTADTRRRVDAAELLASHPELRAPIESLIRARLLTAHEHEIEVAHEALIREWAALRTWVESDRELLRLQYELARAAQLWQQSGEAVDLWGGGRLARALELRAGDQLTLSASELAFLDASASEAEREASAERERQQRELEAARSLARSQASAARRLRVGLASAALLLAAFGAAAYSARRAQRTAQSTIEDAIGVAQLMVESVDRDLRDLPGAAEVRSKILASGASLLDRLAGGVDAAALVRLRRSRAEFHQREAELAQNAQQPAKAREELEASLAIRKELAERNPDDAEAQLAWATAQEGLGRALLSQSARAEAQAAFEQALSLREQLAQRQPANVALAQGLASTHRLLGDLFSQADLEEQASVHYQQALVIRERLIADHPEDAELRSELAETLVVLSGQSRDLAVQRGHLERALAIAQPVAQANPDSLRAQQTLSSIYERTALLQLNSGELERARATYAAGLAIDRRIAERDPAELFQLSWVLGDFGLFEQFTGRLVSARSTYEETLAHIETQLARGSQSSNLSYSQVVTLLSLAELETQLGRFAQARRNTEHALAISGPIAQKDPSDRTEQLNLHIAQQRLGAIALRQGKLAAARAAFGSASAIAEALLVEVPEDDYGKEAVASALTSFAELELAEGELSGAQVRVQRAFELVESIPAAERSDAIAMLDWCELQGSLAAVAQAQGRFADAAQHYARAAQRQRELLRAQPQNVRAALEIAHFERARAAALVRVAGPAESSAAYEAALAAARGATERDPENQLAKLELADAHGALAGFARSAGRLADAHREQQQAQDVLERLLGEDPDSPELRVRLARAERDLAQSEPDPAAARALLERARGRLHELLQAEPEDGVLHRELALCHQRLAELARREGRFADAFAEHERSAQLARAQLLREPSDFELRRAQLSAQLSLAATQQAAEQPAAARETLQQALAAAEENLRRSPGSEAARSELEQARAQLAATAPAP